MQNYVTVKGYLLSFALLFYYLFFGLSNQTFLSFLKTIQDICWGSKAPDHNFILSYQY